METATALGPAADFSAPSNSSFDSSMSRTGGLRVMRPILSRVPNAGHREPQEFENTAGPPSLRPAQVQAYAGSSTASAPSPSSSGLKVSTMTADSSK